MDECNSRACIENYFVSYPEHATLYVMAPNGAMSIKKHYRVLWYGGGLDKNRIVLQYM